MAHRYAGQLGPFTFTDLAGNVDISLAVEVRVRGTATPAPLYVDRLRSAALANPLPANVAQGQPGIDDFGNVILFAEPGVYDVRADFGSGNVRVYPFQVPVDPAETEDERADRIADDDALEAAIASGDAATLASANAHADGLLTPTTYRGTWDAAVTDYVKGDRVTYQGSSYDATGPVAAGVAPGTVGAPWQLTAQGVSDPAALIARVDDVEVRVTNVETDVATATTTANNAAASAGAAQTAAEQAAADANASRVAAEAAGQGALGTAENPVTDPNAVRPSGIPVVWWIASTKPANALANDIVLTPETVATGSTVVRSQNFDVDTATWRAMNNASAPTRDTSSDAGGTATVASLRWTSSAAGTSTQVEDGTTINPVTPSKEYTFSVALRNASGASRNAFIGWHEYTSAGAYLRTKHSGAAPVTIASGSSYTTVVFTATTGADAAMMRVYVTFQNPAAAGEPYHADNVRVETPA